MAEEAARVRYERILALQAELQAVRQERNEYRTHARTLQTDNALVGGCAIGNFACSKSPPPPLDPRFWFLASLRCTIDVYRITN